MDSNALESLFDRVQKPARYTGGELNSVIKDKERMAIRFAFAFPDLYEVGMSHLGMKILYGLFNAQPDVWCERVFMPDRDMEALLREEEIPLFALESRDALGDFDFIGFTLQYEMCYTTVLHMLDLAGIPLRAADRDERYPLVVGGGPCACNPEPVADFFDLFTLEKGKRSTWSCSSSIAAAGRKDTPRRRFSGGRPKSKGCTYPPYTPLPTRRTAGWSR